MPQIADKSIDMILCDLPYQVLHKNNPNAQWDKIIPFDPLWEQYKRIIKDNGAIVLFAQGMFTAQLMMSNPKMWRYNLIWDKGWATGHLNCNRMPLRQHEDIAVFYRELPTYNPQKFKVPDWAKTHTRGNGPSKTNRCYGNFEMHLPFEVTDEKYPRSIIHISKKTNEEDAWHPTQKPVDLLRYLILTYSNEGDTILDATIGSGTTAVAALMEKRHFIGFETNKEYFDIAQGRIDQVRRNPTLNFNP
jgi:DNA modification methylase